MLQWYWSRNLTSLHKIWPLPHLYHLCSILSRYSPHPTCNKTNPLPLRRNNSLNQNIPDNSPLWFAPKTMGILSNDVRAHAMMYGVLTMAYEQSIAQYYLQQVSHHLTQLDHLTATLYLIYHKAIRKLPLVELISHTLITRRLVNKTCASWQRGIEQMMTTSKLVTVRNLHSNITPSIKRKTKRTRRTQQGVDRVAYRDTFNTINSTLAKHETLSITLKQSNPTIITVN